MDDTLWRRAEDLFLRGLDLDDAARARLLDEGCGADTALRELVERMLEADAGAAPVLDSGREELAALLDPDAGPGDPTVLGPWEVIRRIGRGGMSTVYLGRRADGAFEREVALKVIPAGLDAEQALRRFRSEVRLLARLEHPNVARLYDAGVQDGSAWLAMEYVAGRRIDEDCDARGLDLRGRIRTFLEAGRAVQHAHRNLIVHRDLKPSNILVAEDGTVKLLDFGIASLLETDVAEDTGRPPTRFRAMTVEYASPEQISGEPVTTTSDVYSLGVVLYELLTGARPQAPGRTSFDTARAVVDEPAIRPSTHRPELGGDLDTILLKALEKEPDRRYASVESLLDDLQRHLDGRPVLARPATFGYRARKFVARNRIGVATAAGAGLALLTGLGAALWQAEVAAEERDRARVEAMKAQRVADFLVGVFRSADPEEARADTLTAAQILDLGAARLEVELAGDPVLQADLKDVVGGVYLSLSLYERAESLLVSALDQRRRLLGPEHPDVAESLHSLANLAQSRGEPEADSLYRAAAELRRRTLGPDHPLVAASLVGLAFATIGRDDAVAESALAEASGIYEGSTEVEPQAAALALYARGFLRHSQGRYGEAEAMYREALEAQRSSLGRTHPETLVTLSNLGSLLQLLGRYEAADSALHDVLEARRSVFGERHVRVSNSLVALAELHFARGDYDRATEAIGEARSIRVERLGVGSPSVAVADLHRARILQAQGELAESGAILDRLVSQAEARSETASLARLLNAFAVNLEAQGEVRTAEGFYRRSWQAYRRALGDDHPFAAIVQGNVAAMRLEQGDVEGARELMQDARRRLEGAYGPDHPTVGTLRGLEGTASLLEERPDAAERDLAEALRILEGALPEGHFRIGQTRVRLGVALARQGRLAEADTILLRARPVLEPQRGARPRDWRELLSAFAELRDRQGRPADADTYRAQLNAGTVGDRGG